MHKVSKLVHTAKCKFYTEGIALASYSEELHQIVNTFSNRHPFNTLPTIYPSADLPSIFIKHFTNKVEKLRANIASEHVASTLVTGTTAATFSSFEKVSQLKVKECIINSAPKSCEFDTIPSKLLIECLDSILPSLTDLLTLVLHLALLLAPKNSSVMELLQEPLHGESTFYTGLTEQVIVEIPQDFPLNRRTSLPQLDSLHITST